MYVLRKTFRFEASHQLKYHDGKCARLHGHSWILTVEVEHHLLQHEGPKKNMLIDYGDISAVVKPIVDEYLDHWHLNDTLQTDSPTSEFIAKWAFSGLIGKIPWLHAIEVDETCTSKCRYTFE